MLKDGRFKASSIPTVTALFRSAESDAGFTMAQRLGNETRHFVAGKSDAHG